MMKFSPSADEIRIGMKAVQPVAFRRSGECIDADPGDLFRRARGAAETEDSELLLRCLRRFLRAFGRGSRISQCQKPACLVG